MKIAYIAHPISGDIEGNLERVRQIGRQINLEEPDVVPFAPYWFDCHCLDDNDPGERERGIDNDRHLLQFVDEVRLYGNKISRGMWDEIDLAKNLGIPVIAMTPETEAQL